MPKISEFFGISIYMYYDDHDPPHFHARYGGVDAMIDIESGDVIHGQVSARLRRLVAEWATERREELRRDWELARQRRPLEWIEPLD